MDELSHVMLFDSKYFFFLGKSKYPVFFFKKGPSEYKQ